MLINFGESSVATSHSSAGVLRLQTVPPCLALYGDVNLVLMACVTSALLNEPEADC